MRTATGWYANSRRRTDWQGLQWPILSGYRSRTTREALCCDLRHSAARRSTHPDAPRCPAITPNANATLPPTAAVERTHGGRQLTAPQRATSHTYVRSSGTSPSAVTDAAPAATMGVSGVSPLTVGRKPTSSSRVSGRGVPRGCGATPLAHETKLQNFVFVG